MPYFNNKYSKTLWQVSEYGGFLGYSVFGYFLMEIVGEDATIFGIELFGILAVIVAIYIIVMNFFGGKICDNIIDKWQKENKIPKWLIKLS